MKKAYRKILFAVAVVFILAVMIPFAFATDGERTVIDVGDGQVVITPENYTQGGTTSPADPDGYILTGTSSGVDTVIKFENPTENEVTFDVIFKDLNVRAASYSTALTIHGNKTTNLKVKVEGNNKFQLDNWCLFATDYNLKSRIDIECSEDDSLSIFRSDSKYDKYYYEYHRYTHVYINGCEIGRDGHVHSHTDETLTCIGYRCDICKGYYSNDIYAEHKGGTQTCCGYKCDFCDEWYGEKNPDKHNWNYAYCNICYSEFPDDQECPGHKWDNDGMCLICCDKCLHTESEKTICTVCSTNAKFAVMKNGTVSYHFTFADAYNAAEDGSVIKLINYYIESEKAEYNLEKKLTIDLNGEKWCKYDGYFSVSLEVYSDVTITDSVGGGYCGISVYVYEDFSISGGEYSFIRIDGDSGLKPEDLLAPCYAYALNSDEDVYSVIEEGSCYNVSVEAKHTEGTERDCGGYICTVCDAHFGEGAGEHNYGTAETCYGYQCGTCGGYSGVAESKAHVGVVQTCKGYLCEKCCSWYGMIGDHDGSEQNCKGYLCRYCNEYYGRRASHFGTYKTCAGTECRTCYKLYGSKAEHDMLDGICTKCYYAGEGVLTLRLKDYYGDGWGDNSINLYTVNSDGTETPLATYTIASGSEETYTLALEYGKDVKIYWTEGECVDECALFIYYNGYNLFASGNMEYEEDGKLICTVDFVDGQEEYNKILNKVKSELIARYGEAAVNKIFDSVLSKYASEFNEIFKKLESLNGISEENEEVILDTEFDIKDIFKSVVECLEGKHIIAYAPKDSASCSSNATEAGICSVCGDYKVKEIAGTKLSHSFTSYQVVTAATCTTAGEEKAFCDRGCGAVDERAVATNGNHTYDNACDTECNACKATRTITHNYTPAICTTPKTCTVCKVTDGKALGHSWSNACDTACNRSGCTATRKITHNYAPATCTAPKTCTVCKATSGKALGHSWSNACDTACNRSGCTATRKITHTNKFVTTKVTLTKNGKIETKCTVCGKVSKTTTVYYPKTIKLSATKLTYNGKVQTPKLTIKDSKGNTLKKGTDYTVKLASGRKATGKYTVTITFKGNYSGTKTLSYNILPSKTSKITITSATTSLKATWKAVTGATGYKVELLNSKGKAVKTVTTTKLTYTFKKLSKVTTYKVRVTAYKTIDSKKVYSTVSTLVTTSTAPAAATLSKVTAGSKSATPVWKKVSGASGYEIQYSTSKNMKSVKTATVNKGATTKTTIKKLTSGKTYYFKVRAYKTVDGAKVYGAWSAVKSVKIK